LARCVEPLDRSSSGPPRCEDAPRAPLGAGPPRPCGTPSRSCGSTLAHANSAARTGWLRYPRPAPRRRRRARRRRCGGRGDASQDPSARLSPHAAVRLLSGAATLLALSLATHAVGSFLGWKVLADAEPPPALEADEDEDDA